LLRLGGHAAHLSFLSFHYVFCFPFVSHLVFPFFLYLFFRRVILYVWILENILAQGKYIKLRRGKMWKKKGKNRMEKKMEKRRLNHRYPNRGENVKAKLGKQRQKQGMRIHLLDSCTC
jgi:hypothetical protein